MRKYINPDEPGREQKNKKVWHQRDQVDNLYCPRDGHYCEQPDCDNCMHESTQT